MRNSLLWFAVLLLSGCAYQPIALSDRAAESHAVPVRKVVIDNLSIDTKITSGDVVYVNGWAPAHAGFAPPLHEVFAAKLKNSLVAAGETGRVDIAVLRVGLFYEKNVADDVIFVGLFTAGRERGIKCDADVNVKTEDSSRRVTVKYEVRRALFADADERRQFIEDCQSALVRQVAELVAAK